MRSAGKTDGMHTGNSSGRKEQTGVPTYRATSDVNQCMMEEGAASPNKVDFMGNRTSIMKVTILEEKIPEAAWKALHPFPNLNLEGKIQIWERDEAYRRWKDGCLMSAVR